MNFLSLEYFVAVAEEKSVSKAAARYFVSQQSISEHIKRLENELDATLFNKTRPRTLTAQGERTLQAAREILDSHLRLMDDIAFLNARASKNSITLGIASIGEPPFLLSLLSRFSAKYPDCTINIVSRNGKTPPREDEDINLFFLLPPLSGNMRHVIIKQDYPAVVVNKRLLNEIYGDKTDELCEEFARTEDLSLLRDVPFIDAYRSHTAGDSFVSLDEYGIRTVAGLKTDSGSLSMSLCIQGVGALVALEDMARRTIVERQDKTEDILLFRLSNTGSEYSLAVSFFKNKQLSHYEQAFIDEARQLFPKPQTE